MYKILFYNKFISCFYMFRALCAHHQEVKIVLYSIWYHHTRRWPSRAQSSLNLCTGNLHISHDVSRNIINILLEAVYIKVKVAP